MSKFMYSPTVGIDVSANFSVVAILAPNGDVYKKPFKIKHDLNGFEHLVLQIEKVEKQYNMKPGIFMESTGVYHILLFHFLKKRFDNTFIINPLITNCNKNDDIRKVKNDKKDALKIAKLGKFQTIKATTILDENMYAVKSLCRDYYKFVDSRSNYKKKLSSDLSLLFPGYTKLFSDVASKASRAILKNYGSPELFINGDKDSIINLISTESKQGKSYAENKYNKLLDVAKDAYKVAINVNYLYLKVLMNIEIIEVFDKQAQLIIESLDKLVNSDELPEEFGNNVELLQSMPGVGKITSLTIMSEIGDIRNFKKPKQLVAYFGLDCGVNESGKFKSTNNKISKRGSKIARRALYAVALASIRTNQNGKKNNEVILEFYNKKIEGNKAKKIGVIAVTHKLVNYIFAILRNQKSYEIRNPDLHCKMFLENNSIAA